MALLLLRRVLEDTVRGRPIPETMMALRRYLTAEYDWTGLSRLMYRSAFWEIGILALVSAIIVALFTLPQNFGFRAYSAGRVRRRCLRDAQ